MLIAMADFFKHAHDLLDKNEVFLRFAITLTLFFIAPGLAETTQVWVYAMGCLLHVCFTLYDLYSVFITLKEDLLEDRNLQQGLAKFALNLAQLILSFGLTCTLFASSLMSSGALSSKVIPSVQGYYQWFSQILYQSGLMYFFVNVRKNSASDDLKELFRDMATPICGAWIGFFFCTVLFTLQNPLLTATAAIPFIAGCVFYMLSTIHSSIKPSDHDNLSRAWLHASNAMSMSAWLYLLQLNVSFLIPIAPNIPSLLTAYPTLQSLLMQQMSAREMTVQIVSRSFAVGLSELFRDVTQKTINESEHREDMDPYKAFAKYFDYDNQYNSAHI